MACLWSRGIFLIPSFDHRVMPCLLGTGAGCRDVTPRTSRVISSGSKSLSRRVLPSHASVWVKLGEWWIDVWVFEPVKPSDLDFFGGVSKLAMWMSAYQSCLGGSHRLIDLSEMDTISVAENGWQQVFFSYSKDLTKWSDNLSIDRDDRTKKKRRWCHWLDIDYRDI